jgi:hypothetical protein
MSVSESVLYVTKVRCQVCGGAHNYAHQGPPTPIDQDAPWPNDLEYCPLCASGYPDDLAVVIEEVREIGRSLHTDSSEDR